MSKITVTVSGPVGVGKSAVCAKLEILLKRLGCQVEWIGGKEEQNLTLEDWTDTPSTPIEIVERVDRASFAEKVYETYSGQNGWLRVSQEEYDRTKDQYHHRIRIVPAVDNADGPCVAEDGCPTERAVLQRFWRSHAGRPPQLIDQSKIDELFAAHSEWTPYGFAMVDSDRQKFTEELLALVHATAVSKEGPKFSEASDAGDTRIVFPFAHMSGYEPFGFMMRHKLGGDRGFSWVKHDLQFSEDWARVGLFTEEQLAEALTRANDDYNERAKKWRDSFDAMHRRAMKAEGKIAEGDAIVERMREILKPQAGMPLEDTVAQPEVESK